MIENHIEIEGINGRKINIDYRFKESKEVLKPIVYVHGFKGFKDWGSSNVVANTFAKNGFFFLKFNFSHNGVTAEHPTDFVDLEAFGNNNYWIELRELGLGRVVGPPEAFELAFQAEDTDEEQKLRVR